MLAPRLSERATEGAGQLLVELVDARGASKIEVWRRPRGDGSPEFELVQFHWGSGVGWYVQQRLALDAQQAEGLAATLAATPVFAPSSGPPAGIRTEVAGNVVRLIFPDE